MDASPHHMSSSLEHIQHSCAACRKLITQQLEARDDLARALAQSPQGASVGVLQDKVRKLQAATEIQFLKAMDALVGGRR